MKNSFVLLAWIITLFLFSCTKPDPITSSQNPNAQTNKIFDIIGKYDMNDGPHSLAVKGNFVFACRDDKVYVFDLTDEKIPAMVATIDDLEKSNVFETLLIEGNILYAGCTSSAGVYIIDVSNPSSPVILGKNIDQIDSGKQLKPFKLFYQNNVLWAAGSNGTNGMLVKYNARVAGTLTVEKYWVSSHTGDAAGGVWANNSNVFISTASGTIYAFNSADISTGAIGLYTFEAESGHSHWGRTIIGQDNNLYWADWGAGFITVDISNPASLVSKKLITNSAFKTQFPEAEGTDVYDLTLDSSTGKIYVANGWSGLLRIDTNSPGKIEDYIDYSEQQYYCIAKLGKNVIVGNISGGISGTKGIKIIKVED